MHDVEFILQTKLLRNGVHPNSHENVIVMPRQAMNTQSPMTLYLKVLRCGGTRRDVSELMEVRRIAH